MNGAKAVPSVTSNCKRGLIKITKVNKERASSSDACAGFRYQAVRFSFNYACISLAMHLPLSPLSPPPPWIELGVSYAKGVFLRLPGNRKPGLIPALAAAADTTRHNESH